MDNKPIDDNPINSNVDHLDNNANDDNFYHAQPNNLDNISADGKSPEETKREHDTKANAEAAKAVAKAFIIGGTGGAGAEVAGKLLNSPVGDAVANKAGEVITDNLGGMPMGDKVQNAITKAYDSGLTDMANKALDMGGGGTPGASGAAMPGAKSMPTKSAPPANNNASTGGGIKPDSASSANGSKDLLKEIKKPAFKLLLISFAPIILLFLIFCIVIMGPITGAMLDLTSSPTSGDNASTTQVAYTTEEIESSLIYVGDQRMINLQSSLNNSNISFITSSDGNYSWLYGTAEGAINSSVTDKEKFVVLALGLNDLNDIDNYINEYNALITKNSKANFYVLSVNPVDDSKATTITNSSIETFNSKLKSTFGEKYIDTYSVLESSYVTLDDGISYDDNTNKTIHNTVVEYIKSKNMKSVGSTTFLDSYSTEGAGGNILMESLVSKIGQDGLNKLNSDIAANVNSSGKCTGNAVAAAAVTLINELLQKKIIIPYVYGGGHDVVSIGADGSWGTLVMGGTTNIYKGLDCSSFVSWAMTNAGIPMNGGTSDLMKAFPNSISFANAKPGDILIKNGHVMLVIENKGTYFVTAEARTPQYGVVFSQYKYTDKYISDFTVRDTSSYYQSHCNK